MKINLNDNCKLQKVLDDAQARAKKRCYDTVKIRHIGSAFLKSLRDRGLSLDDCRGCRIYFGGGHYNPFGKVYGTIGTIEVGSGGSLFLVELMRGRCDGRRSAELTDRARHSLVSHFEGSMQY